MARDLRNTASDARMGFVVLTGLALALVGTGVPVQAQTSITSCGFTITAPGAYVVGANLGPCPAAGILIEASNVQLTLNGHTITGTIPTSDAGVGVDPGAVGLSGILIQGPGFIRNFRAGIGIRNVDNIQITRVTSANNIDFDLAADTVTGLVLQQNVFARNGGVGLYLNGSSNGQVQNNDVSGNGASGMVLSGGSGNVVANNIVNGNNVDGILIVENNDQVQNNTTNGNQNSGIHVASGASGNQILRNTSEGSSTGSDLEDDNVSCGTNKWRKDTFFTSNQACIQ